MSRRSAQQRFLVAIVAFVIGAGVGVGAYWFGQKNVPSPGTPAGDSPMVSPTIESVIANSDHGDDQIETVIAGLRLLEANCSACHAIGPNGDSPHPLAPPFRTLHTRYDVNLLSEALVEGLVAHPDMPQFQFTTDDANAVLAYLNWLQTD